MKRQILVVLILLFNLFLLKSQTDTEFWFVAPDLTDRNASGFDIPILFYFATQDFPATIRLEMPANPSFTPLVFTVPAFSAYKLDVSPYKNMLEHSIYTGKTKGNNGIHIISSSYVTVHYELSNDHNPDIFTLKGKNALGTSFYTVFQTQGDNTEKKAYTAFNIVATEDNTNVFIIPKKNIWGGNPVFYANDTIKINLNKGETFIGAGAEYVDSTASYIITQKAAFHPDGTEIFTNGKKIAVTLHDCSATGVVKYRSSDLRGDQIVPVDVLGKEYIAIRGKGNFNDTLNEERIYFLALTDNEKIYINGNYYKTIDKGQSYFYELKDPITHIRSVDSTLYVFQISGNGSELGGALLPPTDACTGSSIVSLVRSGNRSFFFNLLVRKGAEGSFKLNGIPSPLIQDTAFKPVNGDPNWLAMRTPDLSSVVAKDQALIITNSKDFFHVGVINANRWGTRFGFFSNFNKFNSNVINTTTGKQFLHACYGESTNFVATGGIRTAITTNIKYKWNTGDTTSSILITPLINKNYIVTVMSVGTCQASVVDSGILTVNPPLQFKINALKDSSCSGEKNLLYSNNSYSYKWSTGFIGDTLTVYPKNSTNYTVTVSDVIGCIATSNYNIYIRPLPKHTIIDSIVYCQNDTFLLPDPPLELNFTFSTKQAKSGNYFSGFKTMISITDKYSCNAIDSIYIKKYFLPIVDIKEDSMSFCEDNKLRITTLVDRKCKYLWNTGDSLSALFTNIPGWYNISVTDDWNCKASDSVFLKMYPKPQINLGNDTSFCENENIYLQMPEEYSYIWSNGLTGNTYYEKVRSGNISVTATNVYKCSSSDMFKINVYAKPSKINLIGVDTVYEKDINTSYSLNPQNGHTYFWFSPPGAILNGSPMQSTISVNWNNYVTKKSFVIVKDIIDSSQCFTLDSFNVTVIEFPKIRYFKKDISCNGKSDGTIQLDIIGGISPIRLFWQDNTTDMIKNNLQVGYYTVSITDKNNKTASEQIKIEEPEKLVITDILVKNLSCYAYQNGQLEIKVSGGIGNYFYFLNSQISTNSVIDNLSAGNYTIIVSDQNNCSDTSEVLLTQPMEIEVKLNVNATYCKESTDGEFMISISGGTPFKENQKYLFYWNDELSKIEKIKNLKTGEYSYYVKDSLNCSVSGTAIIPYLLEYCEIIPNAFSPNNDGINDTWDLHRFFSIYPSSKLFVYNRWGEIIYSANYYSKPWEGKYKNLLLPIDSYYYIIETNIEGKNLTGNVTIVY